MVHKDHDMVYNIILFTYIYIYVQHGKGHGFSKKLYINQLHRQMDFLLKHPYGLQKIFIKYKIKIKIK